MNSKKNAIVVGILLILAIVSGLLTLSLSEIIEPPGYLLKIAGNETQFVIQIFMGLIMGIACATIVIFLYPVIRRHSEALALGAVCFRIIEAVLFFISSICLFLLISLSNEYIKMGASNEIFFNVIGNILLSGRKWTSALLAPLALGLGALMYYLIFFKSRLIPKWLSVWGILGVVLHVSAAVISAFTKLQPASAVLHIPIASFTGDDHGNMADY